MITEIEIEDVGTFRLPNVWQQHRIKQMPQAKRLTASMAFGLGMTVPQFKTLSADKQAEAWRAWCLLTSPANICPKHAV